MRRCTARAQVVETRDWQTQTKAVHREMPLRQPKGAGMETRYGVKDHLGKIHYLPTRYGTAEALGTQSYMPKRVSAVPRPSYLTRSPSMAELDELLRRRSQARGRGGGPCSKLADKVHPKWSVLYGVASSSSVSMIPTDR